jgi:peroxiredoxin
MQSVLLIARIVLFAVFAVAGVAKLADRTGCRQMLIAFGVPNLLANPLGIVLPVVELVVAAALLPIASAWFGAVAALLLLFLFISGIAFNLAQGRTPECNCFGQFHSAPIGWSTMVRNITLAVLAGFIVWNGDDNTGLSIVSWLSDLTVAQRVAALFGIGGLVLLGAEAALLLQVLQQQGRLLLRLDALETGLTGRTLYPVANAPTTRSRGLPIGSRAPSFRLNGLDGQIVTLEALTSAGKPVLLFFTNPHCGPCGALMPEIGLWQRQLSASLRVALVSEGTAEHNRAKNAVHEVGQVLLQQQREVAEAYQAWGTPAAVVIGPDGAIGSPVVQGADAIRALVAQAVREADRLLIASHATASGNGPDASGSFASPRPPRIKIGDPAPPLEFPDLSGKTVALTNFKGDNILVLFWNPGCGFCQQMLPGLKAWEVDPPSDAPKLLVVSTGAAEDNRAMNLRSPVVLDDSFQAGAAFGASGTPMGVLIDAAGRIASELAAGPQAVLALARAVSS